MRPLRSFGLALAACALGTLPLSAQTLVTYDGVSIVDEFAGPPDPAFCSWPSGPAGPVFALKPFCGPGLNPVPAGSPGIPGGVAYDPVGDLVFVSDGSLVEYYTAGGQFIDSFRSPIPIFGMGFDSTTGVLWATDGGAFLYGLGLPPIPTCGALAPMAMPPFQIPVLGPLSGVDWDPFSNSLWAVDMAGMIHNVLPGGAPGPISAAPFPIVPGPCWPTTASYPYLRLALDDASPFGPGHLYICDGFTVASILPGGAPAPPTFAFPGPGGAPCFPTTAPTIGLAFAAHAVYYGAGYDPDGLPAPRMGSFGASTTPSTGFGVTLTGAVPFAPAYLVLGAGASCPTFPIFGVKSLISPFAPWMVVGIWPTDPTGSIVLPMPLPGTLPVGLGLYSQWLVLKPFGPSFMQSSDAIAMRIGLP